MADDTEMAECNGCGAEAPRAEMFGVQDDLRCEACAQGVRTRMQVRTRRIVPDTKPIVTMVILGIAGLFFLLDHVIYTTVAAWPDWYGVLRLWTNETGLVWFGNVGAFLGAAFWHGDLLHVAFNAWWIWDLGRAIEWGFGRVTMAVLFIGAALASSGLAWMTSGPGIGLSGVVYAFALFLWEHRRTNPLAAHAVRRSTIQYLGAWFVICIVLTQMGTWNIGNVAHGAGAAWGWAVGRLTARATAASRKLVIAGIVAGTLAIAGVATQVGLFDQADRRAAILAHYESAGEFQTEFMRQVRDARAQGQPAGRK